MQPDELLIQNTQAFVSQGVKPSIKWFFFFRMIFFFVLFFLLC